MALGKREGDRDVSVFEAGHASKFGVDLSVSPMPREVEAGGTAEAEANYTVTLKGRQGKG